MALLLQVTIKNFRNVTERVVPLGIKNTIEGKNRSGKTNTLNAIHWAFTGKTIDGSNDNRANFPLEGESKTSVTLDFGDFLFTRTCEMVDGTPTVTIWVDGEQCESIKNGEARLHAKLGLSDIIIQYPKFDIVRFLLNPLYFDTVAPKDLRKFLYGLANINFNDIEEQQTQKTRDVINYYITNEPYALCDNVDKRKKGIKKNIETCKAARVLFPSIEEETKRAEKDFIKTLKEVENDQALAEKYALAVSKRVNAYYQKAMGLKVCLLEKGVGDGVFKDVCYPILPKSNLPFAAGSYAERSYIGMRFIQEVCLRFNIKPLPILLDNMESLDSDTEKLVDSLGVQYIGALVK